MLNVLICHLLLGAALAFDRGIGPLLAASAVVFLEAVALTATLQYGFVGGIALCCAFLVVLQGGFVLGMALQIEASPDPI